MFDKVFLLLLVVPGRSGMAGIARQIVGEAVAAFRRGVPAGMGH